MFPLNPLNPKFCFLVIFFLKVWIWSPGYERANKSLKNCFFCLFI